MKPLDVHRLALAALLVLFCGVSTEARSHCTCRSQAVRRTFRTLTGYPHGRSGYVIDHVVPLCAGGRDVPGNMQWQTITDAKAKDRIEKAECAALRKHPKGQP